MFPFVTNYHTKDDAQTELSDIDVLAWPWKELAFATSTTRDGQKDLRLHTFKLKFKDLLRSISSRDISG